MVEHILYIVITEPCPKLEQRASVKGQVSVINLIFFKAMSYATTECKEPHQAQEKRACIHSQKEVCSKTLDTETGWCQCILPV